MVEHQLPKLRVAGSIPVSRSLEKASGNPEAFFLVLLSVFTSMGVLDKEP